jgi:hypothetical protein
MFNFSDLDYSNENNTENVIDKQSRDFLKKQKNIINTDHSIMDSLEKSNSSGWDLKEGFTNPINQNELSKGISSFNDPSKLYNSTYSKPLEQNVTNTIDYSKKQTKKTEKLLRDSSNRNDIDLTSEFNNQYNNYSQINTAILNNTQNFINTDQQKDINVYVDSLSNNSNTQFVNLYNVSNNSNVVSYGNMDIDSCMEFAKLKGYNQFSLSNTNGTTSQCNISSDISNLTSAGIYVPNCKVGSDGNIYGGPLGNAIYENVGTNPQYIGCYKDMNNTNTEQLRAMTSAGLGEMNVPVYVVGNYGCGPWGGNTFPVPSAQWIWYTENSASNAPTNVGNPVTIRGTINVTSTSIVFAEIYALCDNSCTIVVNSVNTNQSLLQSTITDNRQLTCNSEVMSVSAYSGNGKTGYIVPLNPGTNYIDVNVVNSGGPAGLVLALIVESSQPFVENNLLNITASSNGTQFYCTNGTDWTYLTDNSNLVTPYSQSFSIESCGKYAYDNGYQYFGLQNIINGNLNSLQCFVSNDLNQATQYGSWDGSVTYEGNVLGIGSGSAVYTINSSGNYDNIGKVGYVNEQNQLLEYPSSMIQYGSGTSYTSLNNIDSPGNDIANFNLNKADCEQQCNQTAGCYGYVSRSNQCWIKNSNVFSYSNLNGPLVPFPGNELNIRGVQVINDNSCPKDIKSINTYEWDNYNMSQEIMNPTTTCGLENINEELVEEKNQSEIGLNWITSQISNGLSSLMTTNKEMTKQMDLEHNIIKNNISLYDVLHDKYVKMMKGDYNNVNNILANSQISVLQSRYFYVVWAILAIAIIIGLIILIRKYT